MKDKNLYLLSIKSAIRMISEGSCETKGWSDDAENQLDITKINYILQYFRFQIENS